MTGDSRGHSEPGKLEHRLIIGTLRGVLGGSGDLVTVYFRDL